MEIENNKPINHHYLHVAEKKKRSGLSVIKIALLMLRHKSSKKPNNSLNVWRRIMGAMRPLHQHHIEHHRPVPSITVAPRPLSTVGSESSLSSLSNESVSQYASAQNLQELDNGDDYDGDEMIDARAEEFIANFYEQMRLQRMESIERNNGMVERQSKA